MTPYGRRESVRAGSLREVTDTTAPPEELPVAWRHRGDRYVEKLVKDTDDDGSVHG